MGERRRILTAIVVSAVALMAAPGPVGAAPAPAERVTTTATVDFGVIGVDAIEAWWGTTLGTPTVPDPTGRLSVTFGLVSDRAALRARARSVSDPTSPDFGVHGTVAEEGAALNASDATIAAVVDWLADRGVGAEIDPTGAAVIAELPVAVAEEAFVTTYGLYPAPDLGPAVVVLTPAVAPTALAPGLAGRVDRVAGAVDVFDTGAGSLGVAPGSPGDPRVRGRSVPTSPVRVPDLVGPTGSVTTASVAGGTPFRTGTPSDACPEAVAFPPGGDPLGLSPGQLRTAYGVDALWEAAGGRGTGARIAVVDTGGYDPADLAAFRDCFGLAGTEITPHLVGTLSAPVELETALDLEVLLGVAPEAERIDWYVGFSPLPSARQIYDLLRHPLEAGRSGGVDPDVVSVSFGFCETQVAGTDLSAAPMADILDQMLETAVAAGVGYFVATGDYGATGCWSTFPEPVRSEADVWWPASSPWVVAVGGTNLTLAPDNTIVSSGVWNDRAYGPPFAAACTACGGGGGTSRFVVRPWYQRGPGVPDGALRTTPDVAAMSDLFPGYLVRWSGAWTAVGGTSAATPLVAAALAVDAAVARRDGRPSTSFVNPRLYDLAVGGDPGGGLRDVVLGDNASQTDVGFPATPDYDVASGLGSPRFDRLLADARARWTPVRFTG